MRPSAANRIIKPAVDNDLLTDSEDAAVFEDSVLEIGQKISDK